MADDDRTIMMDAIGAEPGGANAAQQFQDVGSEDGADATVMWTPDQAQVPTEALDPQSAATVVLTPEQAAAAIAKAEAHHPSDSGSNRSVAGGLGVLLAFASVIGLFFLAGANSAADGKIVMFATGGLMIVGYGLWAKAMFGLPGAMARITGGLSALAALVGIPLILIGAEVMSAGDILTGPWLAGVSWFFGGLWAFGRGGGLGIAAGLFNAVGGLMALTSGLMLLGVIPMNNLKDTAMFLLGASAAILIGGILTSIIMFTKIDRNA